VEFADEATLMDTEDGEETWIAVSAVALALEVVGAEVDVVCSVESRA
jgi:hypothetical protein